MYTIPQLIQLKKEEQGGVNVEEIIFLQPEALLTALIAKNHKKI